jgi:hypothetical protein
MTGQFGSVPRSGGSLHAHAALGKRVGRLHPWGRPFEPPPSHGRPWARHFRYSAFKPHGGVDAEASDLQWIE